MGYRNVAEPQASAGRAEGRTNWRLRGAAIRKGFIVPHPIPCRLVKVDGVWVEGAWIQEK